MLPCQKSFPLRTVHENHLVFTRTTAKVKEKFHDKLTFQVWNKFYQTLILSSFKIRGKTDEYLIRKNGKHDSEWRRRKNVYIHVWDIKMSSEGFYDNRIFNTQQQHQYNTDNTDNITFYGPYCLI